MNLNKYFKKPEFLKGKNANQSREAFLRSSNKGESRFNIQLLIVIVGLSLFGAVMIYSSSIVVAVKQDLPPEHYFLRQLMWILIGLVFLFIAYKIDYHIIAKLSLPGLIISIVLLVVVLIVNRDNDIKRWIDLTYFDLQPSEIAKITLLVYLSSFLAKQKEIKTITQKAIVKHIKTDILPFLGILGLVCGLIVIEPDMDTTIMLGVTGFILYFISGNDTLHTIGSVATGAFSALLVGIMTLTADYRMTRFKTFFDFWKTGDITDPFNTGFQFRQILIAVASGGMFGVGFGESRQKYHYLGDTAFSDTIFAIFAEEFGLIGCIVLVGIFIYIFLLGYKIAMKAPDKLGFLIAIAITTWITLQAVLHIGANVALIPINGNTLPFMSYGGSSIVINLAAIGILLNISRGLKPREEKESIKRKPQFFSVRKAFKKR